MVKTNKKAANQPNAEQQPPYHTFKQNNRIKEKQEEKLIKKMRQKKLLPGKIILKKTVVFRKGIW